MRPGGVECRVGQQPQASDVHRGGRSTQVTDAQRCSHAQYKPITDTGISCYSIATDASQTSARGNGRTREGQGSGVRELSCAGRELRWPWPLRFAA